MPSDFNRPQLFVVGNDATNHLRAKQLAPGAVQYGGAATVSWTPLDAVLIGASGSVPGLVLVNDGSGSVTPSGDPVFIITGAAMNGTVDVDLNVLEQMQNVGGLDQTRAQRIKEAFINGGQLNVLISATPTPVWLYVQLRAFKSNEFVLGAAAANPHIAHVAHYLSGAGNNLSFADVLSGGEPQLNGSANPDGSPDGTTGDYTCVLNGAALTTESNITGITLTSEGHLVFPSAGAAPDPKPAVTPTLTVTRTTAGGASSTLPVEIHVRSQLIIMLDRSGSMGANLLSGTKWEAATHTANLFSRIFGTMPARTVVGGDAPSLAELHQTLFGWFRWTGGGTLVEFDPGGFAGASTLPQLSTALTPGGGTPIGEALTTSLSTFTATSPWTRRHIVLLTDGMGNAGDPRLEPPGAPPPDVVDASNFPSLDDDSSNGVVLHSLSYARATDVPLAALQARVNDHHGNMDATVVHADPLDAEALQEIFLGVIPSVLPVERSPAYDPAVPHTVEDDVDRLMIVSTRPAGVGLAITTPSGVGTITPGFNDRYSWVVVDGPVVAGDYAVTTALPAGTMLYAFSDLSLRTRVFVDAPGVGKPIRLSCEVHHRGFPVSGAKVSVSGHRPAESIGAILTKALNEGLLIQALRRKLLDEKILREALAAAQGNPSTVDHPTVRRQLLHALEVLRGLPFQHTSDVVLLPEAAPGRYELLIDPSATQNEEVYTFRFRMEGRTPTGHPFVRGNRKTVVLPQVPEPSLSETTLTQGPQGSWVATVLPRGATGNPLGPGLNPYLAFRYRDPSDTKALPRLVTVDNLDGTYSTTIAELRGTLPDVGLYFGPAEPCNPSVSIGRPRPHRTGRHVVVRLRRIQVLDDKDPCLKGKGELVFNALVTPNASPSRSVSRRLPTREHYEVSSGESIALNEVIYSGIVENGASLTISISGQELDWPACFDHHDKMTRYVRTISVPTTTTKYTPDDEKNDPESLADWKVWYTVEVS